jgi:outer membrane protein assembly factor BamE (lipoprotein component of BamABCDE complex)
MKTLLVVTAIALPLLVTSCVSTQASQRDEYLALHLNLDPGIRSAIATQQVVFGMQAEEVRASLGVPSRRERFTRDESSYEVWLYPSAKAIHNGGRFAHLDQGLVRLVFLNDRLQLIEPIS